MLVNVRTYAKSFHTHCNGFKEVQSETLICEVWLQIQDSWEQLERDMREDFSFLYFQVRTDLGMFKCFERKGTSSDGAAKSMLSMTHCR